MEKEKQMSESFIVAQILASVGGYFDVYTYVCRDQVFANAQTGNIVRLGITFANGEYMKTVRYFIPVIAFSLGVLLTMFIRNHYRRVQPMHWRQIILIIEMIVIFIVSLIPIGQFNIFVNIMISFICAMQAECFRKVLSKPFSSTMCTGNLRSGIEYLYYAIHTKDRMYLKNSLVYICIIVCFIIGAILGVLFTNRILEKAIILCLLPMMIALCVMFEKKK